MTGIHQAVLAAGGSKSPFLFDIIQQLGLPSLQNVFDAADPRSTNGTSQTWTDVAANNNYQRGSGAGSDGGDPTFNGTSGIADESTYWSLDGGDWFQNADSTFLNAWIKDAGVGTLVAFARTVAGANQVLFDGDSATANLQAYFQGGGQMSFTHVTSNIGSQQTVTSSGLTVTNNTHHMLAWAFDEAVNEIDFYVDGNTNQQTWNASTRTNNRTGTQSNIGTNFTSSLASGTRIFGVALANARWSSAQLADLYARVKERRMPSLP